MLHEAPATSYFPAGERRADPWLIRLLRSWGSACSASAVAAVAVPVRRSGRLDRADVGERGTGQVRLTTCRTF